METAIFPARKFGTVLSSVLLLQLVLFFESCQKKVESSTTEESAATKKENGETTELFYFTFKHRIFSMHRAYGTRLLISSFFNGMNPVVTR